MIDEENINLKRLTKYASILLSLTSWIANKAKKYKTNDEYSDNDLVKSIIDECEINGWRNW